MNTGDQASPSRDNCSPVTPTPLASSSPAPATCHKRKLQCMEINCGSIRSTEHAAVFAVLVNQYKADIIFGCESQLNSDYPTSAFPPGYTIHRADRLDRDGGGNFIAVIASIPSYVIEDLPVDPDDESLWVSVRTTRSKEIFLCAFYKPPSAPASRIDLLSQVVHMTRTRKNTQISLLLEKSQTLTPPDEQIVGPYRQPCSQTTCSRAHPPGIYENT